MKKLLLLLVIASVSEAISPQRAIASSPAAPRNDIKAVEQTYQNTTTLKAEFTQSTYVPLLEKTITRPGRIFYERGGKLRIEYAGEKMTHYISDGQTLWVVDPKAKEMQTYPLQDSGLPAEALRFLTELGHLKEYFNVTNKGEKIILNPKNKSTYSSLDCLFGKNNYLTDLTIHTKAGNTSQYRFFNISAGAKFSPKLFQP